jgi:putative toxin-antitoxin system antitoxin component (TIGR02293 family)
MVQKVSGMNGGASVLSRMGEVLGLKLGSELDALRLVTEGISTKTYRHVAHTLKLKANIVAPESTVRRRLGSNARFSQEESERVVRLARVYAEAVGLFGDESAALAWFTTPSDFIHDKPPISPMELSATDVGARLVEAHIQRTAHGFL